MSLSNVFNTAVADDDGNTALIQAVKNNDHEMMKKLLDMGADINIKNSPSATNATPSPMPQIPMPGPAPSAPAAGQPPSQKQKKAVTITKMATERNVAAPQTARFRKKTPPKRKTTL